MNMICHFPGRTVARPGRYGAAILLLTGAMLVFGLQSAVLAADQIPSSEPPAISGYIPPEARDDYMGYVYPRETILQGPGRSGNVPGIRGLNRPGGARITKAGGLVVNAVCGALATNMNWKVVQYYDQEKKRFPEGARVWIKITTSYANRSGTPNAVACPSYDSIMGTHPGNTKICVASYDISTVGVLRHDPRQDPEFLKNADIEREKCIQTQYTWITGTGEKLGEPRVALSPASTTVKACEAVTLTATITAPTATGEIQEVGRHLSSPLFWWVSRPMDLQELSVMRPSVGEGDYEPEARAFQALKPGSHTVYAKYTQPGAKTAIAAAQIFVPEPTPVLRLSKSPEALLVGDSFQYEADVFYEEACIDARGMGDQIEWSATGGEIDGGVYHATEAGDFQVTARYTDRATGRVLEQTEKVIVDSKDDLVVSITATRGQANPCEVVVFTASVSTRLLNPVDLPLDWSISEPDGLQEYSGGSPAAGGSGVEIRRYEGIKGGTYLVTARLRDAGDYPPAASATVVIAPPTVDYLSFSIFGDIPLRPGDSAEITAFVNYQDACVEYRPAKRQELKWEASGGRMEGPVFTADKPGEYEVTVSFTEEYGGAQATGKKTIIVAGAEVLGRIEAGGTKQGVPIQN